MGRLLKKMPQFLGLILVVGSLGISQEKAVEWYQNTSFPLPRPILTAEMERDRNIFSELQIPAILALIKFDMAAGSWPKLSAAERQALLDILDDPDLELIFSGKQSLRPASAGGQVLNRNQVQFNQEGFYFSGVPRSPYEIARIILHELGHIHQERHNWLPRPGLTKEWFPNSLEAQLEETLFSQEEVARMKSYMEQRAYSDISGTWWLSGGGTFEIQQSGSEISWTLSIPNRKIKHFGQGTYRNGVFNGSFVDSSNPGGLHEGEYKNWKISADGRTICGDVRWWAIGDSTQTRSAGGGQDCYSREKRR